MDGESKRSHNRLGVILQNQPSELESLCLHDLSAITNNFCDEHLLGKVGFGIVYKGVKPNGDMIAVKKLTFTGPVSPDRQFENEVRHLMGLKHPNIVQLVGYCFESHNIPLLYEGKYVVARKSERLICLEYLPKGSLREHLSDEKSGLDWDTRYRIIQGICYGLHYLHEVSNVNTPIIHMHLQPTNILLDDNMVPKIANFGLSSRDGMLGYMAPEYINIGIITKKLDTFSLGVTIIEIMTGGKEYPCETEISSQEFTELVLKNWRNRLENASRYAFLETDCQQIRRCIEIGLACVKVDWEERPTTWQIIKLLHGLEGAEYNNERLAIELGGAHKSEDKSELVGKFKRKIKSWMRGALLGSGSFGTVYEGISDEGTFFAVKEVSLLDQGSNAQKSVLALEQEIALLSQFEHENIVQYYGTDKEESKLYIFIELVTQGSLASLYHRYKLRDSQVSAYTRQILSGLVYLHERNVVHRDIKCANILVHANGSVNLADFGLAKEMSKSNMLRSCKGSVYWMAPEVANPRKTYGPAADIWSLGCTVLEMLTRQVPYPNVEWTHALFMIGRGEQPPIPSYLSKEAQDFISQCVRVDPDQRPSATQLLEQPFVNRPLRASFESSSPPAIRL